MVRNVLPLKVSSEGFLDSVDRWYSELPVISLKSLLKEHPADHTALVIVDVVNGFTKEGNLSSPRVAKIIKPVVELVRHADSLGVNHYLLPQDQHPENSLEFEVYPRHCVEGSYEAKTVEELQELPNAYKYKVFPKRSINPALEPDLQSWLNHNEEVTQFIVVGDCTDICIHQMAMYLKIRSIARNVRFSVVVPANCVDTYNVDADPAHRNAPDLHPGDLMHCLFLYHMHLNGVRVVAEIE